MINCWLLLWHIRMVSYHPLCRSVVHLVLSAGALTGTHGFETLSAVSARLEAEMTVAAPCDSPLRNWRFHVPLPIRQMTYS